MGRRTAIGYRSARGRQASEVARAAPIGGLNGRDALGAMPPTDAYQLDNWFPQQDGCITRKGSIDFATGMVGNVETVSVYSGGSSAQLLGFASGSMWNCTAGGVVGAALKTGRTNNKIITTMFANAATQFLIGVNGVDEPFSYNGTAYAGLVITGVTGGQNGLAYVHSYKTRLYFANTGQLGFYYLATGAIQGAATYFDLAQVFTRGGYLMGIGSLSQSAGSGPDDYIYFLSSEGEIVVYSGSDPSSASAWGLVGRYQLGRPFGRRCIAKYGGDSLVITDMGLLPVSVLFQDDDPSPTENALSYKLGSILQTHADYSATYGWQVTMHPHSTMLIMNAPFASSYYQYVMNTVTGSWCRFTGWTALCFAEIDGKLYFGTNGGVIVRADTGTDDNGDAIRCDAKQAYDRFGTDEVKHFLNARVKVEYGGDPPLSATFNVDYKEGTLEFIGDIGLSDGPPWDTTPWDTDEWGASVDTRAIWLDVNKVGFTGALWLRAEVSLARMKWFETEFTMAKGALV